jgi:hypothetical protein
MAWPSFSKPTVTGDVETGKAILRDYIKAVPSSKPA